MSRLKIHISRLFKSKKINVLLVFVLLALLFSLLTKLSKDYTKTISFDIEMTNVPSQYVILKDSVQMLDVTLTSSGFNLLKYYLIDPQLILILVPLSVIKSTMYGPRIANFKVL